MKAGLSDSTVGAHSHVGVTGQGVQLGGHTWSRKRWPVLRRCAGGDEKQVGESRW